MNASIKAAALGALRLLPATTVRDVLVAAIGEERTVPRRVAHVTKTVATSRDDEEWFDATRFVELTYESGVLRLTAYDNNATMIGASQNYDYRLRSDEPLDGASETNLKKWLDEWRELLAPAGSGGRSTSIY